MDLNDLRIDPEFEEKIPPLTEDEFLLLEQNIVADGEVLDPLIIWNNTILDGHNRYRILKKHPEIPFKTYPKDFSDKYAAIAWICNNQLGRRNLTPEQRRYLIGKRYEAEKASHGGPRDNERSATGQFTASLSGEDLRLPERTSEKIAAETNTSRSFVENAERFAHIQVNKELQRVNKKALADLEEKDVILRFPVAKKRQTTALVLKTPKTISGVRRIFLPTSVARMLVEWKEKQDETKEALGSEYNDYNLVFAGPFGICVHLFHRIPPGWAFSFVAILAKVSGLPGERCQ